MKKRYAVFAAAAAAAIAAGAQSRAVSGRNGASIVRAGALAAGNKGLQDAVKNMRVTIDNPPKLGRQTALDAPAVGGASLIGKSFIKPRKWIVLETKYTTYARWQDNLIFTWHVLLDARTATEKDKTDKIPQFSYYTTTVTYQNVPHGTHAASVCLHPSNLERFGEPHAVGIEIANKNGELLAFACESDIPGISSRAKNVNDCFWKNPKIMDKKDHSGAPVIERRQGLVDRSKTIWALVNPNDYEQTAP